MTKTSRIVKASMFAALICAATYIHFPVGSGYVHPADGILIIAALLTGPLYGGIAAAVGSAFADIFAGFIVYVPATFVIKGLMALVAGFICKKNKSAKKVFLSAVVAETVMIIGYFIFELFMYKEYAFVNLTANIIQGVTGIIFSLLLYPLLSKKL